MWETARRAKPGFKVANVCWWYAMGATTDLTVTPRPIYFADGKKEPDCYTWPPALHDRLTGALGEFPLFTYWGPTANITSSRWIAQAARKLLDEERARHAARLPAAPRLRPPALRAGRRRVRGRGGGARRRRRRAGGARAGPRRHRRRALRVRDHRRAAARRRQPRAAPRRAARGLHAGGHGVPRPVGVARLRGRRPPDRARLRQGPRRPAGDARRARRAARPRRRAGGRRAARRRPRPRARGRDRARRASPTRGSPTTTGSTTSGRPTSRATWRSTASPATTRPSSSSTRRTSSPSRRRARRSRARSWASATR